MKLKLGTGVWGVVATPFTSDAVAVDHPSLRGLVAAYERLGATGLTVLGVFGEAASLSAVERVEVLRTVLDEVSLPLVVGVTPLATSPVVEEIARVRDVVGDRLAGAMVQLNSADPDVLARHLNAAHQRTGVPLVAQNYPLASGVSVPLTAEIAALARTEGLAAVKEEAPPTAARISRLVAALDAPVFGGLGGIGLVDELDAGAAGAMTGFSCPEGLLAAVRAFSDEGVRAAQRALAPYLPLITFEQQPAVALAIRKYCLRRRGLIGSETVREPAAPLPPELRVMADRHLDALAEVAR